MAMHRGKTRDPSERLEMPSGFKGENITDNGGPEKGDGRQCCNPDIIASEERLGTRDRRNKEKRQFHIIEDRKPLSGAEKAVPCFSLPQALETHVRHPLTCNRWEDLQGLDLRGQRPMVGTDCYKRLF